MGFLVADDADEHRQIQDAYTANKSSAGGLSLTIAPTVSCNFACSYCFQEHPKRHMNDEDIVSIKQYVSENLVEGEYLAITWFGGEPLAKFPVVKTLNEFFMALTSERSCQYTQSMITNGSLLSEDKIKYLHAQGNMQYVQITVDGPKDIHDMRRPTTAGRGTFDTIFKTLERVNGRLPIAIRVNLDRTNVHRIPDLIDSIAEQHFANTVSMYFGHVISYTEACGDTKSVELTTEEFAHYEANLGFLMLQKGMRPSVSLPRPTRGNVCVADHERGAVVSPGGITFGCWNETALPASQASGRITEGEIVISSEHAARDDEWKAYDPFSHEMCRDCDVMPLCRGGCPWEARKMPVEGTGHCTPLRFNLAERLRLYHMVQSIDGWDHGDLEPPEICG